MMDQKDGYLNNSTPTNHHSDNPLNLELSCASSRYGGGKGLADLIYEKKRLEISENGGLLSFKGRMEEAAVEETVVEMISRGEWSALKANSGECVGMGDHYVCVYCEQQEEMGSLYRVWQWNGFVRVYSGAARRDYICGHYFEAVDDDDPEAFLNLGTAGLS